MKNKILTEEIIRIQKIMGVPTNLIMEAAPNIPFAEKGAKELWATIERIFGKELEQGTEKGLENTIKRLEYAVGKENVEAFEQIMKGGDDLRTKKANIIDRLSNDEIIQKDILNRIESNNLYKKEIEFFRDKYIREPQIKSFLDDTYAKCLNKKNGNVEDANNLMRRALSVPTVNFPEEALERYLNTSTVNKVGFNGWNIKLKDVEPPVKPETPLGIDPDTGLAWEGPLDKNSKESIGSIIRKTGSDISTLQGSNNLKWLNRRVATNKSILNKVRPSINNCLIRYEQRTFETSEKIKNIFNDIIRITNKYKGGDLKSLKTDEIQTELRDISQKINRIQNIYEADKTLLYNEIEASLLKNIGPAGKEKIPEIMKEMRRADPFRATLEEGETRLSRSYWFTFLDNTAMNQTLYNVGRIIRDTFTLKWSKALSGIKELTSRIPGFLLTGSPKTWEQFLKYTDNIGWEKGLIRLYYHIWFGTHVGLPLIMATWHTLENMFYLATSPYFGTEKGTPEKDYMDNLKNDFLSQYQGYPFGLGNDDDVNAVTIVLGALAPGHVFLDDVIRWGYDKTVGIEEGKFRPDNTPEELIKFFFKNKIEKPTQDLFYKALNSGNFQEGKKILEDAIESGKKGVEKTKEKATEVVTDIVDSEAGFKAWCLKNNYKFISYNKDGIGTTGDNRQWEWKKDLNTFGQW